MRVTGARGFTEGLDYSNYIAYFIDRLKREVLWDVSHGGMIRYNVEVYIDLLRESYFKVSLDGGPYVFHNAPTFCDGLYAPVVSGDHNSLENMAMDVSTMLTNISGALNQQVNPNQPAYGAVNTQHGMVPATTQPYTGETSL